MITAKRVDIRYATALLQTAAEQGLDKAVYTDMLELRILFLNNADFRSFLRNPAVKPSQKARILQVLFKDTLNRLTLDFLLLVLKKSRINNVQGIITAYVQLYRKEHHLKTVSVYTANGLSDPLKTQLHAMLSERFPSETIELRCQTRPELIGGVVLRDSEHLYDDSISGKLGIIQRYFETNPYETKF